MKVNWHGVFPAITTQFHDDQSLNIEGTARHLEAMIQAGIHGVVLLGTVGENTALEYQEKLTVVKEMLALVKGRIPVLTGVAEYTTALGCRYARDVDGPTVKAYEWGDPCQLQSSPNRVRGRADSG